MLDWAGDGEQMASVSNECVEVNITRKYAQLFRTECELIIEAGERTAVSIQILLG